MKVLCINSTWMLLCGRKSQTHDPKIGDICTVVDEFVNWGYEVYVFAELTYAGGYKKDCFIPISDIDELELVNEKEEVV